MSREDDLKLLEAVRNWRPPESLHPSAMVAAHLYEDHGMSLPDEAIRKLDDMMEGYGDDLIGRAEALEGLTRFMMLMKMQGDEVSEEKMARFLREHSKVFEPFWERVGEALENVGEDTRSVFFKFVDASRQHAPKFGAEAPQGTVPLKDMMQPGRPPPWAKKKD